MKKLRTHAIEQAVGQTLVITRTFNAPRNLVFKAWTEPQRMRQWWGPKGFTCPFCEVDLRVGGAYRNCMRSSEGRDYWSQGVFHEIEEPSRIVYSDAFGDEQGNIVSPEHYGMSDDWPTEAIVTLTLTEHVGKTRLMIQHWPIKPGPERDMCQQGWNEMLDKLGKFILRPT